MPAPLHSEPVGVMWPEPERPPESPAERLDRLSAQLHRTETLWYRGLHDNRRMLGQVVAYIDLVKAVRAVAESPASRWYEAIKGLGQLADEHWARIREQAAVNRAIDARLYPPRDREPAPAPPHDIAEFRWADCQVYKSPGGGAAPWRISWRGGDVCVVGHLESSGAFWDILTFSTKKAAVADLATRRDAEGAAELTLFDWDSLTVEARP